MGLALALLIAGCVSPRTTQAPVRGVDLRHVSTVRVLVTDAVNSDYSKAGLPMFRGLLEGQLESKGYTLVNTNAEIVLAVKVHEFDPGSRTMRLLVGFGAGKAVLKYTATFLHESGNVLARLEGGKAYHGMELVDNASLKSDESIRTDLLAYSVSQITEFMQSNGARSAASSVSKPKTAHTPPLAGRPTVWSCPRFSPDGGRLAAIVDGTSVFEFGLPQDLKGREVELPFGPAGRQVIDVNYNDRGDLLVLCSASNVLSVLNAQRRSVLAERSLAAPPAGGLLSRDGQRAVIYSKAKARHADTRVELINWGSQADVSTLAPHPKGIRCLAFAADGRLLATMDGACVSRVWNTDTGALVATLTAHKQKCVGVALDEDGDTVAMAGPSTRIFRLQGQQCDMAASVPNAAPKAGTAAKGAGIILGMTLLGQPCWDPNWFKSAPTFGVCLTDKGDRVAMLNHSPKIGGGFELRLAEADSGRPVTTLVLPDWFWPWGVVSGTEIASYTFPGDRTPGQPTFSPDGQFAAVPGSGIYILDFGPVGATGAGDLWLARPPSP